jgi:peptidyl-dipeptidase Dcp
VPYYTALYKKEKLSFDEAAFSEYLEVESVLQGWLLHSSKSMNIGFVEIKGYPVWHPDVRVYKTIDYDSGKKGLLYVDLYKRDQKEGAAWMDCLQAGEATVGRPNIISFNMNLAQSLDGSPILLSISDLETFYHEGGHCLNGIKGTESKYRSRQGTTNTSDFYEIHSMIDENWATHPDVLATYAFHYKTGALIPRELLKQRNDSNNFMASADLLRMLQNARRDMFFHATLPENYGSDEAIEAKAALNTPYSSHLRPYPLTRFSHMFTDGLSPYAAGYYGYFFSDMAQAAAFELFDTQGVYHSALTARKRAFYAIGGGLEPNAAYEAFTGFPAGNPKPLLAGKGIVIQEPATRGGSIPTGQPAAPELAM